MGWLEVIWIFLLFSRPHLLACFCVWMCYSLTGHTLKTDWGHFPGECANWVEAQFGSPSCLSALLLSAQPVPTTVLDAGLVQVEAYFMLLKKMCDYDLSDFKGGLCYNSDSFINPYFFQL